MRIRTVQAVFFFAMLLVVTLAFLGLIRDFLMPLFWAVVFATVFYPIHKYWLRTLKRRHALAAVASVLTILLIVIVPLAFVAVAVSRESIQLYQRIDSGEIDVQEPIRLLQSYVPQVTDWLEQYGIEFESITQGLSNSAVTVSQFLANHALNFGQNALWFVAMTFVTLYVLFFFLRDGRMLVEELIRILPLGDENERRLLAKFAEVSRATLKGTLVVGIVQGALGGLIFWALGIGAPVFWGVIMAAVSFLPTIGSALIWGAAAIILLITGSLVKGLILIVFGVVVIGLMDNLLRPMLVGRDTKLPDYIVLIATLGGISVFGISGFVIGPVIAALFLVVWDLFEEQFAPHDRQEDLVEPPLEEPVPRPASERVRSLDTHRRYRRIRQRPGRYRVVPVPKQPSTSEAEGEAGT